MVFVNRKSLLPLVKVYTRQQKRAPYDIGVLRHVAFASLQCSRYETPRGPKRRSQEQMPVKIHEKGIPQKNKGPCA